MIDLIVGFFAPWLIYAVLLGPHLVLPARRVAGYVRDPIPASRCSTAQRPLGLLLAVGLWALAGRSGFLPWDWLFSGSAGRASPVPASWACCSAWPWSSAPRAAGRPFWPICTWAAGESPTSKDGWTPRCSSTWPARSCSALNVLSFVAHHLVLFGSSDPRRRRALRLPLHLVRRGLPGLRTRPPLHLRPLRRARGLQARLGLPRLLPVLLCVGLWATRRAARPAYRLASLSSTAVVFFAGWTLSRGANLQKYLFKTQPRPRPLGLSSRARSPTDSALCAAASGALSRHINYLGEILMAVGTHPGPGLARLWVAGCTPSTTWPCSSPRARRRASMRRQVRRALEGVRSPRPGRIIPGVY